MEKQIRGAFLRAFLSAFLVFLRAFLAFLKLFSVFYQIIDFSIQYSVVIIIVIIIITTTTTTTTTMRDGISSFFVVFVFCLRPMAPVHGSSMLIPIKRQTSTEESARQGCLPSCRTSLFSPFGLLLVGPKSISIFSVLKEGRDGLLNTEPFWLKIKRRVCQKAIRSVPLVLTSGSVRSVAPQPGKSL